MGCQVCWGPKERFGRRKRWIEDRDTGGEEEEVEGGGGGGEGGIVSLSKSVLHDAHMLTS